MHGGLQPALQDSPCGRPIGGGGLPAGGGAPVGGCPIGDCPIGGCTIGACTIDGPITGGTVRSGPAIGGGCSTGGPVSNRAPIWRKSINGGPDIRAPGSAPIGGSPWARDVTGDLAIVFYFSGIGGIGFAGRGAHFRTDTFWCSRRGAPLVRCFGEVFRSRVPRDAERRTGCAHTLQILP